MSTIDTGLGWSCDSSFYVDDTTTALGTNRFGETYRKVNAGAAICAKVKQTPNANTIYTVSTVADNVVMTPSYYGAYNCVIDGVTWYMGVPAYGAMDATDYSDFPWANENDPFADDEEKDVILRAILTAANVQPTADKIPTTDYVKTYVEGVEAETARRVNVNTAKISDIYAILGTYGDDVYGLQVDYENYTYTRLAGATGKTQAQIAAVAPWSSVKRCNLADDGTVNAYYGDSGYIEDGSNGQCMTEIPRFYYKMVPLHLVNGNVRKANYYISMVKYEGFKTHPFFIKADGTELDTAYISSYEGCIYDTSESAYILDDAQIGDFTATTGDKLSSIAGAKPCSGTTQFLSRANAEQIARNRGTGWHGLTSKAISALQWLFMISFGGLDSQKDIGRGVVDKSAGSGNNAVNTGATSTLGNACGMADGTDGLVSVSLYGVENPWGNINTFLSDINVIGDGNKSGGEVYIADVSDSYTFPQIISTTQDSVRLDPGENYTLSVRTLNEAPVSYQWQFRYPQEGSLWRDYSNAATASFSRSYAAEWDGLLNRCVMDDTHGNKIISDIITLCTASEDKKYEGTAGAISEYRINDTNYTAIGFNLASNTAYISAFGYDENFDWIFLPSECTNATSAYPIGDSYNGAGALANSRSYKVGGEWSNTSLAGIFYSSIPGNTESGYGARLIYTGDTYQYDDGFEIGG